MNIICNGIQKHGTHALLKAVELLGQPIEFEGMEGAVLAHNEYGSIPVNTKHLFIIRNPKNAFISLMRMHNIPLTTGMLMAKLQSYDGENYVDHCKPYLDWLDDADTLVINFDDMVSDQGQTVMDSIADHLGVARQSDAKANLLGHTETWTGTLSNNETLDAWNDEVEAVWLSIGGLALEQRLGYAV
tara:strand:+ start:1689 stop:2249 length:561 start_codon:yes stop_codon:yes gene_type:complete